jgi:hypothetical protein
MDEQTRGKVLEALMLFEDNERTSASGSGLRHRAANRRKAINLLCDVLGLEDEDTITEMYWNWTDFQQEEDE